MLAVTSSQLVLAPYLRTRPACWRRCSVDGTPWNATLAGDISSTAMARTSPRFSITCVMGELPLVEQARAVYREAQYYQLTGLIEWCERQPNVIAEMMYTRTRQWLGPEYEQLKDRLLGSARERFTRSPGTYLDDKTGFFELTIAFSKKAPARCASGSPTGSASEASAGQSQQSTKSTSGASKTRTDCTEHKFNSDTHTPDAFLPPALDLETTLNFLKRDFHEAGLSTEWSSIYSDGKSSCEVCQAPMFLLYFRIVLWQWVS